MTTVLITNGLQTKTLAVVRSLGQRGIRCIVGEKEFFHVSRFSRYTTKALVYPDPVKHPDSFFEWLCVMTQRYNCDFLIPMDDDVMGVVVHRQEVLQDYCSLLVPSRRAYEIASDKANTMQLANMVSVPHPKTVVCNFGLNVEQDELLNLVKDLHYPLIIKPRVSSGSRGVRFVPNETALLHNINEIHFKYPNPMIQEAVPFGDKFDVCLCYDHENNVQAAFVQREVRNFPKERGPSVVRESVSRPDLIEMTLRLLDRIRWTGIVEVEYMMDGVTGELKLMEINPRYWSSLHLAIESGVDFPWVHYAVGTGTNCEAQRSYPEGVLGRQLLPGDILYLVTSGRRCGMDPPFFSRKYHDELLSQDDPLPLFGWALSAIKYSFDIRMWRFLITR